MNDKQGAVLMAAVLFVLWLLFSPVKQENPEMQPTDGLIEAMQPLSKTLSKSYVHETDFVNIDHSVDATRKVEDKKEIVIFTRPNCPPCDRWKAIEQPKFEKAGWVVAYCDDHNFALTPHFIFEVNGKAYENKGYLPFEKIDEVTK